MMNDTTLLDHSDFISLPFSLLNRMTFSVNSATSAVEASFHKKEDNGHLRPLSSL
jgi:hypothetical protein